MVRFAVAPSWTGTPAAIGTRASALLGPGAPRLPASSCRAPELSAERPRAWTGRLILLLHNRYRTAGGEERAVDDLLWLMREQLGEDAELLERDSAAVGPRCGRPPGCCAAG